MISWASSKESPWSFPNFLCILRGVLGLIIPFLFLHPSKEVHILAACIYTFAAITDYWDGAYARKHDMVSNLGKILDPTTDKILILSVLAGFAYMGFYSPWWLVAIFFREIVVTFCRIGWFLEGKAAGAEKLGKIKLVLQVTLAFFILLELLGRDYLWPQAFRSGLNYFTLFLLITVNILTVVSGITFLKSNRELFKSRFFSKFTSAAGVGLLRGPEGTYGSILAAILIPLVIWNGFLYWAMFAFLFWASFKAGNNLDLSQDHDPGFVVTDEILGMWITFTLVPFSFSALAAGFFLFRFFDIVKPFPCRRLERCPGYWGIALDDLGAGVYACISLHLIQYYL